MILSYSKNKFLKKKQVKQHFELMFVELLQLAEKQVKEQSTWI